MAISDIESSSTDYQDRIMMETGTAPEEKKKDTKIKYTVDLTILIRTLGSKVLFTFWISS